MMKEEEAEETGLDFCGFFSVAGARRSAPPLARSLLAAPPTRLSRRQAAPGPPPPRRPASRDPAPRARHAWPLRRRRTRRGGEEEGGRRRVVWRRRKGRAAFCRRRQRGGGERGGGETEVLERGLTTGGSLSFFSSSSARARARARFPSRQQETRAACEPAVRARISGRAGRGLRGRRERRVGPGGEEKGEEKVGGRLFFVSSFPPRAGASRPPHQARRNDGGLLCV